MKRDIKINYGVLEEVVADVKRFQTALEDVRAANERFEAGLGDYESKAVTNLRSQYSNLLKEMKSCEEELSDIHTIISDYIAAMKTHIIPVIGNVMMRVDRNDIYWNIESMVNPHGQLSVKSYIMRSSDFVPWYRSSEKRARIRNNMENNYDKVDSFRRNRLAPETQKILGHLEAIRKIHKEKVVPYEEEDNIFQKRASQLYNKYTNLWEGFVDLLEKAFKNLWDQCAGLIKAVWDFVVGIVTLVAGLVVTLAAGIVWCVTAPFSGTPKWAGDILKQAGETIGSLVYDPVLIVEGICQGGSDTVEEKGIAYATGYIAGDLLLEILVTKGLGKLKAGKVAGVADEVAEAGSDVVKGASGADDIIKKVKNGDIKLESTKHKGNFGEMVQDDFYEGANKNLNRISKDKVSSLDDKIHQGIDGVYEDPTGGPPKFVISEAKYGTSKLNTLKDGTQQMSDKWVRDRLVEAVGQTKAQEIFDEMLLNPQNVQTTLLQIDKNGDVLETILKNGKKLK